MFLPSLNVVLVSGMWKMSVLYEDCSNVRVFGGRQGKSASDGLHQILKDEIFFLCSPFIPADILCLRCEYFTCITSPYLRDRNILWKIFSPLSILNHVFTERRSTRCDVRLVPQMQRKIQRWIQESERVKITF